MIFFFCHPSRAIKLLNYKHHLLTSFIPVNGHWQVITRVSDSVEEMKKVRVGVKEIAGEDREGEDTADLPVVDHDDPLRFEEVGQWRG
jgi:hypothetical protein